MTDDKEKYWTDLDLDSIQYQDKKLIWSAKGIQNALLSRIKENEQLKTRISKLEERDHSEVRHLTDRNSELAGHLEKAQEYVRSREPSWQRAEQDYPLDEATSHSCFRGPRARRVLVFDMTRMELSVKDIKEVQSINPHTCRFDFVLTEISDAEAVYSKLPSRRHRLLYVWVEKPNGTSEAAIPRYRVTSKQKAGQGFLNKATVNLDHLKFEDKLQIALGSIKWIFILRPTRKLTTSTCSSGHI